MDHFQPVSFRDVEINGGFWEERQRMNRDVTIFAVEDRFRDTGRFEAFKCNWKEDGDLPRPHFFWDSDIAKWMESAAYILQKNDVPELYDAVSEVIDDIAAHQAPDGYFNIYHMVVEPELKWKDRSHHELYCLGHLIEAAVAWYQATGETRFIDLMDKYIDYVIRVFTVEHSAAFTVPGHEEIELALIKLYRLKKEKKYLDLAMFFLDRRGTTDEPIGEWCKLNYDQNHLPVREQKTAEGHSVRACYLYSAMADAAEVTGDPALFAACKALFDDIFLRKMYVTGGIGSSHRGEAFTIPYDLPNDTAYAETCASIALAFFANRMKDLEPDSKYADTVERTLYNGILSGISLDGKAFFYENPLEINLRDRNRHRSMNENDRLPITQRLEVFGCSCCPPNVTRLLASLGDFAYSRSDDRIYVHQFFAGDASFDGVTLSLDTQYPADGFLRLNVAGARGRRLCVRIPGWCPAFHADAAYSMDRGYAVFDVNADVFDLTLELEMKPRFIAAADDVRADAGLVALTYGPLVYCAERVDNDFSLANVRVDPAADVQSEYDADLSAPVLYCDAETADNADITGLYFAADRVKYRPIRLKLIPYFSFANRGESDMRVWLRRK